MKKINFTNTAIIALAAFILGLGFNGIALSDAINPNGIKIGVVDVNKVINSSAKVSALKKQQEKKKAELVKWINTVRADVQKQSSDENKIKLAKKYDAEFAKKQQANQKEYLKKAAELDAEILKTINTAAKAQGYSIVFSKSAVLYGGDDLTPSVLKIVK